MDSSCDQILMQGMVFHSHVGVLEREKENGQDFFIDAVLYCGRLAACDSDQLTETIDYSSVFELIREIVETARFDLIERLAGAIADALLLTYDGIQAAEITVRKPNAPINGRFEAMGVRIIRERG